MRSEKFMTDEVHLHTLHEYKMQILLTLSSLAAILS